MAPKPGLLPEMTMHRRKQSMAPALPNPVDLCRFNKIMAGELHFGIRTRTSLLLG